MKKTLRFMLDLALALLAFALVSVPLTAHAEDSAPEKKLTKTGRNLTPTRTENSATRERPP